LARDRVESSGTEQHLHDLAEEQAALRRIATLVARGSDESAVFDAVCAETGRLVGAGSVNLARFTPDGLYVAVAAWGAARLHHAIGTRLSLDGDSVSAMVWRTAAPARMDSYDEATGDIAALVRARGIRCAVGVPLIVEGRLWGTLNPARDWDEPFPAGTEERIARFAELAATAIANATARSELIASRARIVAAADEARRKMGRNLHDGIQQRLVALSMDVKSLLETLPQGLSDVRVGLTHVGRELEAVHEDVRELARGLDPPLLSLGGLAPALAGLARISPIPVSLESNVTGRLPHPVEIGLYYVVAEALTNAAKYSQARQISVSVSRLRQTLRATITDDGVGGADPGAGSGLTGLMDRLAALGGRLEIDSRAGDGTKISVVLPVADEIGDGGPVLTRGSAES
jgi:signal transduction histidine kinase